MIIFNRPEIWIYDVCVGCGYQYLMLQEKYENVSYPDSPSLTPSHGLASEMDSTLTVLAKRKKRRRRWRHYYKKLPITPRITPRIHGDTTTETIGPQKRFLNSSRITPRIAPRTHGDTASL